MGKEMNKWLGKWPCVGSFALSILVTAIALAVLGWKYGLICIGLSVSWFLTGRIISNYTMYLLLTRRDK